MIPDVLWSRPSLPYPYGKLTDRARMAIALIKHTKSTKAEAACIMSLSSKEFAQFWSRIMRTSEGAAVISMGVPAMYGEQLPEGKSAICTKCGRRLTWVPCVTCCDSKWDHCDRLDRANDITPRALPAFSTDTIPGSAAKIEVLRQRVADGVELWHPKDARIPD